MSDTIGPGLISIYRMSPGDVRGAAGSQRQRLLALRGCPPSRPCRLGHRSRNGGSDPGDGFDAEELRGRAGPRLASPGRLSTGSPQGGPPRLAARRVDPRGASSGPRAPSRGLDAGGSPPSARRFGRERAGLGRTRALETPGIRDARPLPEPRVRTDDVGYLAGGRVPTSAGINASRTRQLPNRCGIGSSRIRTDSEVAELDFRRGSSSKARSNEPARCSRFRPEAKTLDEKGRNPIFGRAASGAEMGRI